MKAWLALCAGVIFLLAYASPVEMVDSDPAMGLVASQALLDHGTLRLDVFAEDPAFAYDLHPHDHRIKQRGDAFYYFNVGLPVVSVPIVWLANRLGYDMLDQDDEFAVQNLVSAVLTTAAFLLLYRLALFYAAPGPSLVIALVSTLGSTVTSTLATGLWAADYQVVLVSWALAFLLARRGVTLSPRGDQGGGILHVNHAAMLAAILAPTFLIRPTTAFFGVACLIYLSGERDRLVALAARLALGVGAVVFALALLDLLPWLPRYYSPRKLMAPTVPWTALYGTLASPSRGLFIFSPFLIPVALAVVSRLRSAIADRLVRLTLLWIALHLIGVALKPTWWGGHSFGPRLLTELMPAFAVLTAWAWRNVAAMGRPMWVPSYLILGCIGIFIHSYQGLFNPATLQWNREPNVDMVEHHRLFFDWRYPQFLATRESIDERSLDIQRRQGFGVYRPGERLAYDSPDLLFHRWYAPEDGWRWSRGSSPELIFQLGAEPVGPCSLTLYASSLGRQSVTVTMNGKLLEVLEYEGSGPIHRVIFVPGALLRPGENVLGMRIPDARSTPKDQRVMGLALRHFGLDPLDGGLTVDFSDDAYFVEGFSIAENGWRWTDAAVARLLYPVGDPAPDHELELVAGAYGDQSVEILVDGRPVGSTTFSGHEPSTVRLPIATAVLQAHRVHSIELRIPGATRPENDGRLLGIALRTLRIKGSSQMPSYR